MTRFYPLLSLAAAAASVFLSSADALSIVDTTTSPQKHVTASPSSRRTFVQFGIVAATASTSVTANAVDSQFKEVGQQERPPEGETPFSTLSSGVQIKDFRQGTGSANVQKGSKVELTMKGRLLNLNGVIFYDQNYCPCRGWIWGISQLRATAFHGNGTKSVRLCCEESKT